MEANTGNGIVLNRMYAGSYLSANIGHEVINMFCDDNGRHFMYLNATGDFAADKQGKIGTMFLIKYAGRGNEDKRPLVEVLGVATGLKDVYNPLDKNKKQDCNFDVNTGHDENKKIKIGDIKYGGYVNDQNENVAGVSISEIFKGAGQQDVLITYYAQSLKVPVDKTRIFIRYKSTGENDIPEQKITGPININNEKHYYIDLTNTSFASTSLKQYVINGTDRDTLNEMVAGEKWKDVWEEKQNNKVENNKSVNKTQEDSIFNICQIEYSENCFSNALAYFMDKYRDEWIKIFKIWLKNEPPVIIKPNFRVDREVNIKDVAGEDGRIDLLIQDDENLIIIENKIKSDINNIASAPNSNQLERYKLYAEKITIKEIKEEIKNKLKICYINGSTAIIEYDENENKYSVKEIEEKKLKKRNKNASEIKDIIKASIKPPKRNHLYVLSPNYNLPEVTAQWTLTTYKDLLESITKLEKEEAINNLIEDSNFKSFRDVMQRHTVENLCDWLEEEMRERFKRVINAKRKSCQLS